MNIRIDGFITYEKSPWDESPRYSFYSFDPTTYNPDMVIVMEHSFYVEVPDDFDPRPGQVAALKAKKEKVQAEFAAKVKEIDDQINSLLAIAA